MSTFLLLTGFITLSYYLGYKMGNIRARSIARQSVIMTFEMLGPLLKHDPDEVTRLLNEYEEKLKKEGRLPKDFQSTK